jgi:hypothetical protein
MQWYYVSDGQQAGPITTEQLRTQAATGALSEETLVWKAGMASWEPLGQVAGRETALLIQLPMPSAPAVPVKQAVSVAESSGDSISFDNFLLDDDPVPTAISAQSSIAPAAPSPVAVLDPASSGEVMFALAPDPEDVAPAASVMAAPQPVKAAPRPEAKAAAPVAEAPMQEYNPVLHAIHEPEVRSKMESHEGVCRECGRTFSKASMTPYREAFVCTQCMPGFVKAGQAETNPLKKLLSIFSR